MDDEMEHRYEVITLRRRPLWKRALIFPSIFYKTYKMIRKHNDFRESVRVSFQLSLILFI